MGSAAVTLHSPLRFLSTTQHVVLFDDAFLALTSEVGYPHAYIQHDYRCKLRREEQALVARLRCAHKRLFESLSTERFL